MSSPNPAVQIREACPSDAAQIAAFNCALALETEEKQLDDATVLAGVARALEDAATCRYFVAEAGGRIVGQLMITYEWSDWRAGVFWWIQSVYVEPAARRQGLFRALYAWVRERALAEPDVCGLRLYVERANRAAQHMYTAMGMEETAYRLWEESLPARGGTAQS